MSTARFGWAGVALLSAVSCRDFTPPATPPLVSVTSAEQADPPPASQLVRVGVQEGSYADTDPSALTDFRATLDPYGRWLDDSAYGTVWVPRRDVVGKGFTPYLTAGRWVYDDDYVWVSDYAWGWAPFHYGRWVFIPETGWAWIPGRAYAGAWVDWRVSDDRAYLGWAPMPPAWIWRDGMAVELGFAPWEPWTFCPRAHVFAPALARRVVVMGPLQTRLVREARRWVRTGPAFPGRPLSRPYMHGPPPAVLEIPPSLVRRSSPADRGLSHARVFARPSTARGMGARPPRVHEVRVRAAPPRRAPERMSRPPARRR